MLHRVLAVVVPGRLFRNLIEMHVTTCAATDAGSASRKKALACLPFFLNVETDELAVVLAYLHRDDSP